MNLYKNAIIRNVGLNILFQNSCKWLYRHLGVTMNFEVPKFIQELDKVLAISGVIFSVLLIIYLNLRIGRFIYLLIGVLSLFSFVGWLIIRKNASLNFPSLDSGLLPKLLTSLFFMAFTLDIVSLYTRPYLYQRPLIHFFIISILVSSQQINVV